ncbi:MAG: D-alanine--D-alanine ligase [Proteobacteria bacterium]|nr:D-alanine--D-alanine ligase [Pseudomonadota bacterium]
MGWKRVGVLLGGLSEEREISLLSGQAVAAGLKRSGYDVVEIDAKRDLCQRLEEAHVDAVFIALHGRWGEDGTVQGVLEMLGIPYTGSPVLASSIAMDKIMTRDLFNANNLPVPKGFALSAEDPAVLPDDWTPPIIVKPANEGSSVGISLVTNRSDYPIAVKTALKLSNRVLVEQFVEGREVTVAVLDGKVLGALEIEPKNAFYDYSAKYDQGGSIHHVPPRIADAQVDEVQTLAQRAYRVLCCSGAARVDFIVPRNAPAVILEINTIPGMTELSLLPDIAQANGLPFDNLVAQIMEGATLHVK